MKVKASKKVNKTDIKSMTEKVKKSTPKSKRKCKKGKPNRNKKVLAQSRELKRNINAKSKHGVKQAVINERKTKRQEELADPQSFLCCLELKPVQKNIDSTKPNVSSSVPDSNCVIPSFDSNCFQTLMPEEQDLEHLTALQDHINNIDKNGKQQRRRKKSPKIVNDTHIPKKSRIKNANRYIAGKKDRISKLNHLMISNKIRKSFASSKSDDVLRIHNMTFYENENICKDNKNSTVPLLCEDQANTNIITLNRDGIVRDQSLINYAVNDTEKSMELNQNGNFESSDVKKYDNFEAVANSSIGWDDRNSVIGQGDQCVKDTRVTSNTVIHFRDINKKVTFGCDGMVQEGASSEQLFASIDPKRNCKKRRYAKLMQKLEDTEKSLDSNIKGIMDVENTNFSEEDVLMSIDKLKEKLCVREKKKYESLINYQRCQANVEKKSFEDLLPEKAEAVSANIVKQLGGDKLETKPKKRGRPQKRESLELPNNKLDKENTSRVQKAKCVVPKKTKVDKTKKVFVRKTRQSSSADSNSQKPLNEPKLDKIRIGIMHKNGLKEVIELSNESVKGMHLQTKENTLMAESENIASSETNNGNGCDAPFILVENDRDVKAGGNHLSNLNTLHTSEDGRSVIVTISGKSTGLETSSNPALVPPTTIQLPSMASLESDYQLISIYYLQDGKVGDFKTDHFFIPQASFNKGGQIGMVIVGPFCVSYEPKPHIVLVPPKEHKKDLPMMILTKKTDFAPSCQNGKNKGSAGSLISDHNYCCPFSMHESVKRFVRGIAKHSANARFIDAKVESIREGQGNSVVTLSGDNIFKKVKDIRQHPTSVPITSTQDGIPVIYNLTQIMTPVLKKTEQRAEREEMAKRSKVTGDYTQVFVPYENMGDVAMEILIHANGSEMVPSARANGKCPRPSIWKSNSFDLDYRPAVGVKSTPQMFSENSLDEEFLISNSYDDIGASMGDHWNVMVNEPEDGNQIVCYSSSDQCMIPIENAADVDANPPPGLACCRMCLRLFPNAYSLFTHVRSCHMTETFSLPHESGSRQYLKELKARSRVSCPICGPAISYCTSLKLKKHLQTFHTLEEFSMKDGLPYTSNLGFSTMCVFCLMDFPSTDDLSLHLQMAHGMDENTMMHSSHNNHSNRFFNTCSPRLSDCLTCSRCNIIFDDRGSLVSHTINIHPDLNQSNTICRLCEREYGTETLLMKHLRNSHKQTDTGAIRCLYCPAWLSTLDEAAIHKMSVHSGDVPVHCPFCGSGYQSMHSMYNHVRNQHLQTESLMCPECQGLFASVRLLSEHARKQHFMPTKIIREYVKTVRSYSYGCPFCSTSFTRTYDLAMHVVLLHKDPLLPAKCHFCLQCFVNPMILKMHIAGAHGVIVEQRGGHQHQPPPPPDRGQDISFLHHRRGFMGDGGDDAIVLEDEEEEEEELEEEEEEEEDYHIPEGFSIPPPPNKEVMSSMGHSLLMDTGDMMASQGMDSYIESYGGDQPRETTVYVDDRNQVISLQDVESSITVRGDIFDAVSTLSEVHLLDDSSVGYSLQGMDYLETLANDHVAVAEDVVADVYIEDIVTSGEGRQQNGGHVIHTTEDMLDQSLEVGGVLYRLAMTPEDPSSHNHSLPHSHNQTLDLQQSMENGVHGGGGGGHSHAHQINMAAPDITHLL